MGAALAGLAHRFSITNFCATINPMKILVISDIHANLTALEAVLSNVGEIDAVWCLGDLVGYGPDPNDCIERVREFPNLACTIGNHDAACLNRIDPDTFNPEARLAIHWTQNELTESNTAFLNDLPEIIQQPTINATTDPHVTLVHGSPRQPVWEYLLDTYNATRSFNFFKTEYCFVGHTHLPVLFQLSDGHQSAQLVTPNSNRIVELSPRGILNPGSVGQPRDRDPRAAYALYDPDQLTWEFRRVEYDIKVVQQRMQRAGLPERHIRRLEAGW